MMYPAIEDHGIIGNLRTAALVSTDATIDFFCPLRFDNPTLFASLLDDDKGGYCSIRPITGHYRRKQLYLPETNVLTTRFLASEGIAEVTDFMPIGGDMEESVIFRHVAATRGRVAVRFECMPAFGYATQNHQASTVPTGVVFRAEHSGAFFLHSDAPLNVTNGCASCDLQLNAEDEVVFVLTYSQTGQNPKLQPASCESLMQETIRYWRAWVSECTYHGRWREMVIRSALILKLLTYEPTGAIVAAPTFALPEEIGGVRNWDYRYTWLRDAAMTLHAFLWLGFKNEALQFMLWLKNIASDEDFEGELQIMYGIDGEKDLKEQELGSLRGYQASRPVRIGNAAHAQLQLDVYGGIGSAALFEVNSGMMIEYDRWAKIQTVLGALSKSWSRADHGLWEIRGEPRHFLHSRLMCWVAFDRAIKIAQLRSLPAPLEEWRQTRDRIYQNIHTDFWNNALKSFVQSQHSADLDASVLLMPQLDFISPADPRWTSTMSEIRKRLVQDASVIRYDTATGVDGLAGAEGAFMPCSFWYIQALTMTGEVDRARVLFEKMLGYANHLGLYAEELGLSGEHLGNFPQALTHLSLIQAALTLNEALEDRGSLPKTAA
jgi:GH15 family glucan-1,4-alpha-glucosidase